MTVQRICCKTFSTSSIALKVGRHPTQSWLPERTKKTLYAVLHALQYLGEAVSRLPSEVTDLAPQTPWAKIRAMRNLIAHDYAGIDTAVIWETVKHRLPEVRATVVTMLQRLPRS